MARHLKPAPLQVEIANAWKKGAAEGRAFMQQIARGEIVPTNETGQPLDFSAGPTTASIAPLVEITKDEFGRTKMNRIEPASSETPSTGTTPHLSPDDKRGFDTFSAVYAKLPDAERNAAMEALVKAYVPRLIHD